MWVSAWQSALFNRYLDGRMDEGLVATALVGDVLKKTDTGGLFSASEPDLADAQARLAAGALVVTGPMFGARMMAPPAGTPAAAREAAVLAEGGVTPDALSRAGDLAPGTRRPLLVPLSEVRVEAGAEAGSLVVGFVLPPGAYATVVLAEIQKP
jgi:tRNA pseudouridine13 synthase